MSNRTLIKNGRIITAVDDYYADVFIDGEKVVTTPTARRIPLPPGRHFLKLSNPYYQEVDQELLIRTGETELVDVELEPVHDVDDSEAGGGAGDDE